LDGQEQIETCFQERYACFFALFSARFSAIVFAGFFFTSFRWSWPLPMGSLLGSVAQWFYALGIVASLSKKVQVILYEGSARKDAGAFSIETGMSIFFVMPEAFCSGPMKK
jgi:hypothetical protein